MATPPPGHSLNQAHVLLLNKLEESVTRLDRQTNAEFIRFKNEVRQYLERNSADLNTDVLRALETLISANRHIRPAHLFDINGPNVASKTHAGIRQLAKAARYDSQDYSSLAAKEPCPHFPAVINWIRHEKAHYYSLSLICNEQASWLASLENNSNHRVGRYVIDLHDQYLFDANRMLAKRIREGERDRENHLHVITGYRAGGRNPQDGIKLRPHAISVCSSLGLKFKEENNPGRIRIQYSCAESIEECSDCEPDRPTAVRQETPTIQNNIQRAEFSSTNPVRGQSNSQHSERGRGRGRPQFTRHL